MYRYGASTDGGEVAESWYERHMLPYLLDYACRMNAVRRQRELVVPLAEGRVLEVDRNVPMLLSESGFRCEQIQTMYLQGPRPFTYNYWGVAVAA